MFSFDARVRYSECDGHGRLGLVPMINYLQDCSIFQTRSLGLEMADLSAGTQAWVLATWQIEIEEMPAFADPISVSTWCYRMTRAHAERSFLISGAEGRPLVRADSQWLFFDATLGHATRVPKEMEVYLSDEPRLEMAPLQRKVALPEEGGLPCPELRVSSRNLDTNRHVNNAQYVLLALEALEALGVSDPDASGLLVQYRRMAWEGDVIQPVAYRLEDGWAVDLRSPEGETFALVRMRLR